MIMVAKVPPRLESNTASAETSEHSTKLGLRPSSACLLCRSTHPVSHLPPSPLHQHTPALLSVERWARLAQSLNIKVDPVTFTQLQAAYQAPHRAYHTATHIQASLALLDVHVDLAQHPAEVELALWFHDAVYHPQAVDNEANSADWAANYLRHQQLSTAVIQRITAMILATATHGSATTPDTQLLLDIDLAILGQDAATFDRYHRAIRQEYAWVPQPLYDQKRRAVLQSFLNRPHIYQTTTFQARYEAIARQNLRRVL